MKLLKVEKIFCLLPIIVLAASCALINNQEIKHAKASASTHFKIEGSFLYREKISFPKNSVAIITLNDISRADSEAIIIAKQEIDLDGKSVPVRFELTTDKDNILHNMRYAVRTEIRNQNRSLLWTTDTTHWIDTQNTHQVLPPITLKQIAPLNSHGNISNLIGTKWYITAINNKQVIDSSKVHLQFAVDGKVFGFTGCNNFSGKFTVDHEHLNFSRLILTRRACIPKLSDQEKDYIQVLETTSYYRANKDDQLTLMTPDGEGILAVRSLSDFSE